MKVGIVGRGAIGSLFAYYYRKLTPNLLVKNISSPAKKIKTLDGMQLNLDFHALSVSMSENKGTTNPPFDAIIIAVKGYQMEALITQLLCWVPITTRLVLIQNGMGGAQQLAQAFPNNRIYAGTTTDAVFGNDENTYQITAFGKLDIGPLWKMSSCNWYVPEIESAQAEIRWAKNFFSHHPNVVFHDDIAPALYTKLAVNAVINPLTACLHVKNGELINYPEQVDTLKKEIFEVYSKACINYSQNTLSNTIDDVIETTSNNWSSMQQDIEYKRQSENDTVLGYLLKLASHYKVNTPYAKELYCKIKEFDAIATQKA